MFGLNLAGASQRGKVVHVLAVFSVVRDRVVHVGDAAFIDQIDDQLQFVQAFEVRHFRCIAGFHQRFETSLDQFNGTAAQYCLFTEQVSFRFFAEVGFDDAGTAAAVGGGIRQCDVTGSTGLVLVHRDQMRHAATLGVCRTHGVAWRLRCNHDHVQIGAWHDLTVVNVEAVGKRDCRALLGVWRHVFSIDLTDVFIWQQDHDDVRILDRIVDFSHVQAGVLGLVPRCAALAQTNRHLAAGILQILGVGMALRTVTDDGHVLVFDQGQVCVFVVENFHVLPK